MEIKKKGTYRLLEPCMGMSKGQFIKVIKVNSIYVYTTIHSGTILSNQPVELVRESVDD